MTMKKLGLVLIIFVTIVGIIWLGHYHNETFNGSNDHTNSNVISEEYSYGVFLGINRDEISKLEPYSLVVIEPEEFLAEDIKKLHSEGKKVYGYINVGAIEEYRDYYEQFESITIGTYEDWPDERWVDVSRSEWQNFIVYELANTYVEMGFDGFFLDNFDVYDIEETQEIYNGLCEILRMLSSYDVDLIINGGDIFVQKYIDEEIEIFIDGVNQETVFTAIDFEEGSYDKQDESETQYFINYLEHVSEHGLKVYLLEYGAENDSVLTIEQFCHDHGYVWYNAENMNLE